MQKCKIDKKRMKYNTKSNLELAEIVLTWYNL